MNHLHDFYPAIIYFITHTEYDIHMLDTLGAFWKKKYQKLNALSDKYYFLVRWAYCLLMTNICVFKHTFTLKMFLHMVLISIFRHNVDDKISCQNKKCINLRDNERSKNNDRLMKKLYLGATLLLKEHISVLWVSIHRKSLYIEMGPMAFAFWKCGIHIAHRYIWVQFPISMQRNSVKRSPIFDKSLVFLL